MFKYEWEPTYDSLRKYAAAMEFEGEGETNDAGPGDADVKIRKGRVVHRISLVRLRRGYSLGIPVCRLVVAIGGMVVRERITGVVDQNQDL